MLDLACGPLLSIIEFADANDAVLLPLYHVNKQLRDLIDDYRKRKQPYPRRIFYHLKIHDTLINNSLARWYKDQGQCNEEKMSAAAAFGGCLEFITTITDEVVESAGKGGCKNVLEYLKLKNLNKRLMQNLCFGLAACGHLEDLQEFIGDIKCNYILFKAVEGGQLKVAQWLHEIKGYELFPDLLPEAISSKNMELIKWLLEQKIEYSKWAFDRTAFCGNLDVILLLQEYGYKFTNNTLKMACKSGNLLVLQFLLDNDCHWDRMCYEEAIEEGLLHVLEWLKEKGCPVAPVNDISVVEKGCGGKVEILEWMLQNNFSVDQRMLSFWICNGDLHMVQWLVNHGIFPKIYHIQAARKRRHKELATWLETQVLPS